MAWGGVVSSRRNVYTPRLILRPRHDLLEALGLRDVLLRRPRRHAREDGLERGHVRRRLRRALRQLCAGIDRRWPKRGGGVTR